MYMFLIFSALFECPDVTSGPGQGQVSDRPGSACKVFNSFSLFKLAQILTFDSPYHSSKSNVKWEVLPEGHCPHLDTGHGSSVTLCHKMMFPGPNQVYVTLGHLLPHLPKKYGHIFEKVWTSDDIFLKCVFALVLCKCQYLNQVF